MMLALSDSQMDAILLAARPLAVHDRDAFLREVVSILTNGTGLIGDGAVHHVIREVQRRYFDPPLATDPGMNSKYG